MNNYDNTIEKIKISKKDFLENVSSDIKDLGKHFLTRAWMNTKKVYSLYLLGGFSFALGLILIALSAVIPSLPSIIKMLSNT